MITIFLKKNNDFISDAKKIKNKTLSILLFFFVGLYGGFIHAGVGFLMILILSGINNLKLSHINSIKVFVALIFSIFAFIVFIIEDKIYWVYGINIGVGSAIGGWIASRWSYNKSDFTIKIILGIIITFMSVKLWFF